MRPYPPLDDSLIQFVYRYDPYVLTNKGINCILTESTEMSYKRQTTKGDDMLLLVP